MREKILILADWFSPGYKAGGLVTALANLSHAIGDRFELFVMTRDRDLGDSAAYRDITANEWRTRESARVLYTQDFSFRNLRLQIERVQPDILYLNSFFSSISVKALVLHKLGLSGEAPLVIAPRGELSPGALAIKARKKTSYASVALRVGLCDRVWWHASSDREAREIRDFLEAHGQKQAPIITASDIPPAAWGSAASAPACPRRIKNGAARLIFISRISPKKNLLFALDALRAVSGAVELDIYGPVDDANYWAECELVIRALPPNVTVRYLGAVSREDVAPILREHDFFVLPTQSENFGYAILEALVEGCPVLISDQTPWNDLDAQGAGWVIPLDDRGAWARALAECISMDRETHTQMAARARQSVTAWLSRANPARETIEMFESVLSNATPALKPAADRPRNHDAKPYADPAREVAK